MKDAHLNFTICKPLGELKQTNYIIPGYLAPDLRAFMPLARRLEGEVVIGDYFCMEYCHKDFVAQLVSQLRAYPSDVTIRLFGFSLGANLALEAALKIAILERFLRDYRQHKIELYLVCPLLTGKCLKRQVAVYVRSMVKIGRVAMKVFRKLMAGRTLMVYGRQANLEEVLSGANAILCAKLTDMTDKSQTKIPVCLILAEDDQYIDNAITCQTLMKQSFLRKEIIHVQKARHCWSVDLGDVWRAPMEYTLVSMHPTMKVLTMALER